MSHRVLADDPQPPQTSLLSKLFADKNLPHWGMLAVALMYIGFNIVVGLAAVPPTISLGFTFALGLWFNYLVRQRANGKNGGD